MYKKLSFTDDISAACVMSIVREDMGVGEDVQAKFIKIIIIWFICYCWFCSIYISTFVISNVYNFWKSFIFCLPGLAISFFKTVCALINTFSICCSLRPLSLNSSLISILMASSDSPCCLRAWIYSTTARVGFDLFWSIWYCIHFWSNTLLNWPTDPSGTLLSWFTWGLSGIVSTSDPIHCWVGLQTYQVLL